MNGDLIMAAITKFLLSVYDLIDAILVYTVLISIIFACSDVLYRMKHSKAEFIATRGEAANSLTNGGKRNFILAVIAILIFASSTCWYIDYIPSGTHSLIAVVKHDSEYYSLPAEVDVYNWNGEYNNKYKLWRLFWPNGEVCYFMEDELSLDEFVTVECCCSDVIDGKPNTECKIKLTREHIYNPYVVEHYDDKPVFSLMLCYFQAFYIVYEIHLSNQYERFKSKE